jgi:hypothetical protein
VEPAVDKPKSVRERLSQHGLAKSFCASVVSIGLILSLGSKRKEAIDTRNYALLLRERRKRYPN